MKTSKFKMTEVGPISEEWEVKRLGDVVETSSGGTPSRARPDFFQGTIKWFTTTELLDNKLYDSLEHISHEALKNSSAKIFPPKTLLMAMYGATIGRLGILQNHASTNQACCAIFCGDTLFSDYAYYYLYHLRPNIIERGCGAGQPNISQEIVRSLPVVLPPLAEQRRIAKALSDVDELISALGKLIEKKRNIKTGTMQELLGMRNAECGMRNVPRRRLVGFSGEWVEKRFDDCFELIGNNTYARECMCDDCDGLANIHYGDVLIRYGSVLDCSRTAVPSLIKSIICRTDRLSDGDVIIADTAEDETVGKAIEIRGLKGRRAVSGLHTIACRPRFDFAPGWLGYYINSSAFHDQLLPLITGTKVSSISKAGLRTTILNVPTLAEQQAIAAVLSDMDAEIAALEAKRAKYESIKQGMMQELLTGKTRLKGEWK